MQGSAPEQALARAPLPPRDELRRLGESLGPFVVLDLETTGLDPVSAEVIEVGALRVGRDGEVGLFHSLVRPSKHASPDDRAADRASRCGPGGRPRLAGGRARAGHLHGGRHRRCAQRGVRAGVRGFRSSQAARVPRHPGARLRPAARMEVALSGGSGTSDVRPSRVPSCAGRLARHARCACGVGEEIHRGDHDALAATIRQLGAGWSWEPLFEGRGASGASARGRGGGVRVEAPERPAIPPEWLSEDFVRDLLLDEPRWQAHVPSYRAREGQIELALGILRAFREDRIVAAEAGTGIGKTLAYTLVSLLHALVHGERVIVSSANRTLQERVVLEEVPRVAAVLGIGPPGAVILKGRANYGSAWRARELARAPAELGFAGLRPASRIYLETFFRAGCAGGPRRVRRLVAQSRPDAADGTRSDQLRLRLR